MIKAGLLITRYVDRVRVKTCLQDSVTSMSNESLPTPTASSTVATDNIDEEYIFTIVIYSFLSMLRVLEYSLLSYGLIKFVYTCDRAVLDRLSELLNPKSKQIILKWTIFWFCILIPYLLLGMIVIPVLGMTQEIMHANKIACYKHSMTVFIAYSSVNAVRYIWDFIVRLSMIFTTLVVRKVWNIFPSHKYQTLTMASYPTGCDEATRLTQDFDLANMRISELARVYRENGQLVETINELFQTWFIFPWITYVIATSLEVGNVLQPWQDSSEVLTSYYPKMYYLMYNINQLISLLVPYLCAKKMEGDHKDYFKRMKKQRFSIKYGGTMSIQKEEDYNFVPRLIGTSIRIGMRSPLYFVFLLVTVFFTTSKTLL